MQNNMLRRNGELRSRVAPCSCAACSSAAAGSAYSSGLLISQVHNVKVTAHLFNRGSMGGSHRVAYGNKWRWYRHPLAINGTLDIHAMRYASESSIAVQRSNDPCLPLPRLPQHFLSGLMPCQHASDDEQ
jgi:hypothetical protein